MLVIGLTGGIGSGKSTVAKLFAEHGVPVIDADQIARELTQPKQPALSKIIRHFGREILQKDGALDRTQLRKIIFHDPQQRGWLEKLLHPLIQRKIKEQIKTFSAPYCITVIPLLFEVKPYPFIDRILVVDTPEYLQIARITSRDKLAKPHIEAILETQVKRDHRLAEAHDIISNEGSLASLIPQVEKLHQFYLSLSELDK